MMQDRRLIRFKDVESLVAEWGHWARRHSERLGLPNTSSISRMMEHIKVFEHKQRRQKRALREARKTGDSKLIAEALGYADPGLTANGKQTRVVTAITIGHVDPGIMRIDRIVADLPGTYYIAIHRRYRWLQPDRIAASQLKMDRDEYTSRANAALEYITERLNYGGDRV